jgi:hypothetical protein
MAQWFQANKMSLNTSKTKYIIFHAPGKKVNPDIALYIDETCLTLRKIPAGSPLLNAFTLGTKTITLKHLNY